MLFSSGKDRSYKSNWTSAFSGFRDFLCQEYNRKFTWMSPIEWNQDYQFELDYLFIWPSGSLEKKTSQGWKRECQVTDLLTYILKQHLPITMRSNKVHPTFSLLVEGKTASGKTMLAKKILLEWSRQIWNNNHEQYLLYWDFQKIDFIDIETNIIMKYCPELGQYLEQIEDETLRETVLRENSSIIVNILDFRFLNKIFLGQLIKFLSFKLPQSTNIIFCTKGEYNSLYQFVESRLDILDLSVTQTESLVEKLIPCPVDLESFLEDLRDRKDARDFVVNPFHCTILAALWIDLEHKLPTKKVDLIKTLVSASYLRYVF